MTDPMHSGFDSLLQDLGVPVEIHEKSTDTDEPAEQVTAESGVDVTDSVVITTADAPPVSTEEAGAPRDDRKRRRRRRRRGSDQGNENGNGQDSDGNDSDREGDEEGETQERERPSRTALVEANLDDNDEEEEEKFVLEDLTNLQFPAWDDLIGSLYKPGN